MKLYRHQEEAVAFGEALPYVGYFMEQGTGKTATAITLVRRRRALPCLVLCPKHTIGPVWEEELARWGGKDADQFTLLNYEQVARQEGTLGAARWGAVVADESYRIKNPVAQVSRAMGRVASAAPLRVALNGVPAPEGLLDLFGQVLWLDGGETLGRSWWKFRERYFMPDARGWEWVPRGDALESVSRQLSRFCHVARKRDCLDLPPKVYERRVVEPTGGQRRVLRELERTWELDGVSIDFAGSKYAKELQVCSGFWYGPDGGVAGRVPTRKDEALLDVLEECGRGSSVVVWCYFREELRRVAALVRGRGGRRNVGVLRGGGGGAGPALAVARRPGGVLVAQAGMGSGFNFVEASHAIYYGRSPKLIDREQSEDRLHRIGQEAARVTYTDIVVGGTMEEELLASLREKRDFHKVLMRRIRHESVGA